MVSVYVEEHFIISRLNSKSSKIHGTFFSRELLSHTEIELRELSY